MAESCDDDTGEFYEHANVCGNSSGPISRSSVTHVAHIVAKFDDVKKDLVRHIGFGGILDMPQITKVDRKFTLWLLTKLDPAKRCIIVNDQCVTDVIDFEVARIIGIPCGRRKVCSLDQGDKKKKMEFIHNFIGTTYTDCNSLTAAENNVKAQYDPPTAMSLKDKHNFKVSFVVWVMGHLLAPTKKHNVGSDRFWGGLISPDEINQFNWADYVIDELMNAALDVQNANKQNKTVSTITGCPILLQILYFESINMGSLNRPKGISPRVKVYDGKSLGLLIAADKVSSIESGDATWGTSVQRLPAVQNDSLSQNCNHPLNTAIPCENDVINDLGKYLRDKFGDKMPTSHSVAFNWFNERCTCHFKRLRLSIQQDTIELVRKLFCSADVSMPAVPPELNRSNVKGPGAAHSKPPRPPVYALAGPRAAHSKPPRPPVCALAGPRAAHSKPPRPPLYSRSLLNNKRGYESFASCYKQRYFVPMKKHNVSFAQQTLADTLLPGMSVSCEDEPGDEQANSGYQSKSASHNSGFSSHADIPSFDLGIEFNTEGTEDPAVAATNNVYHGHQVQNNSSDAPVNPNLSCVVCDLSTTEKFPMKYILSVADSSDGCPTPGWFNALCGTSPSAKSMDQPEFTTPDQRIKKSKTSPGNLSKILAEGDLVDRMTCFEDSPNINIKPWDYDYSDSPINKCIVVIPMMSESPWTYNLSHRNPPSM